MTGLYLRDNLAIDTDTSDMLSSDLPFRINNRLVDDLFPQLNDNLLIVLDGRVPELVDMQASKLVATLRQRPETFGPVFDPEGSPFLNKNGLLFLDVPELEAMTERLADAQPFLASLWADTSLSTLFDLLRQGLDRHLKGDADSLGLGGVLNQFADIAERRSAGEKAFLSWQRLLGDADDAVDVVRRMIVLQPPLDFSSLQPASEALDALAEVRRSMALDGTNDVRMRISGGVALQQDELQSVEQGMGLAGILSFVFVLVLLGLGLRAPAAVFAVLMTLIVGLVWTAGFAIFALGALNLISVAFAVLFIGLSVDFGIHYSLRYGEFRKKEMDKAAALSAAGEAGGGGLTLCAIAAAIAFYSFLPTDYVGLAQLGLIAGTGMFIALFANLTVLPALLTILPDRVTPGAQGEIIVYRATGFIQRRPKAVLWLAGIVALVGLSSFSQARFDFDPLNLQDTNLESVAVIHELAVGPGASTYGATVLADDITSAELLRGRLEALPEVDSVVSASGFVPKDQDEKIEIIQDFALFLLPSLDDGQEQKLRSAKSVRTSLEALVLELKRAGNSNRDDVIVQGAKRLKAAFATMTDENLTALEVGLLGTFPVTVNRLRQALDPSGISLENVPNEILGRYVADNGNVRISVFPKEDLRNPEAVTRFVKALRSVAPNASGAPVTIYEAGRIVLAAFAEAGILAVVAILLLLYAILRRIVDVALVFAPLALAAILTVGFSVMFNVPFNFANIIVLPLLFGLGVASGIHLVLRDRLERQGGGDDAFATSTPRAVMFSALTTIGSFGSIALSGHPGTSSMGVLLTAAIALTLGCTLTLLPALLAIRNRESVAQATKPATTAG